MKKILVTSIGSRVGQGILDSLESRRSCLTIVGTNSEPAAISNFRVDIAYLVPPSAAREALLARLRQILEAEQPDLVLAGRDGDLEPLAVLQGEPGFSRIRFLCPPPEVVAIVRDKHRTYEFARDHGLPFAESAVDDEAANRLIAVKGLPLIGKPRAGNASIGVSVVRTREEALAVLARGGAMLQEFLAPPPDLDSGLPDLRCGMPLHFAVPWQTYYSPLVLTDEKGRAIAYFATRHTLVAGKPTRIAPVFEPALEEVARAFAAALAELGLIGPINVQCHRQADGSFVAFELNARFTGGSSARARLGHNEVAYALDYFLDGRAPPAAQPPAEPCYIAKPIVDWMVREADVQHLANEGQWRPDR